MFRTPPVGEDIILPPHNTHRTNTGTVPLNGTLCNIM